MSLGTLERNPPPFFRQGTSALSKLMVLSALSIMLMVADKRFKMADPLRMVTASVIYPLQWMVLQPKVAWLQLQQNWVSLRQLQDEHDAAKRRMMVLAERGYALEQAQLENKRLRQMLGMQERLKTHSIAAEVMYDAADPYTRRLIINRGSTHGIQSGSPVMDELGVLGQVTQVYPLTSEVTLLIDRNLAIPVLNVRTGVRGVAFGQTTAKGDGLELRFTLAYADITEGDLLATSGIDGIYPAGLPVARVSQVDRRTESSFTRIHCAPVANMHAAMAVLVLDPTQQIHGATSEMPAKATIPPPPPPPPPPNSNSNSNSNSNHAFIGNSSYNPFIEV